MTREEEIKQASKDFSYDATGGHLYRDLECGFRNGAQWADNNQINPWHKASEELPKMEYFTTDGDYSDLCVCINESGEHKILVLCKNDEYTYWSYGYDGEGLYDEEMDGGEIVKWMELPKEEKK